MFGNPQWFRPKTIGFGLVPRSWQGWAYSAAWGSTISLPFWLLVDRHQSIEALLWLALSIGAMAYDVWQILTSISRSKKPTQLSPQQQADQQVLYIVDSNRPNTGCNCRVAVRR